MGSSFVRRAACALLVVSVPAAVVAEVNLDDFDRDVMQAMDDAFKDLEPVLGAANADSAREDVATLKDSYQWAVEYFTQKKDEAPDALDFATTGRKILADAESAVNAHDFATAITKARELRSNCKSCHEKYRPKK